ncbi:MAG: YwiC-like family protein, partial [Actinomycetes bacterium]
RYPRKSRYARPLLLWSAPFVPAAAILVWCRPWLLWAGIIYAFAFAANVSFARHKHERALSNDALFIAECLAIIPLMWAVSTSGQQWSIPTFSTAPSATWVAVIVCGLAMIGSTLHVKSLIRERANVAYRHASVAWAIGSAVAAVGLAVIIGGWGFALVIPFMFQAGRSLEMDKIPNRPAAIGMVELAGFVLVAGALALAVGMT